MFDKKFIDNILIIILRSVGINFNFASKSVRRQMLLAKYSQNIFDYDYVYWKRFNICIFGHATKQTASVLLV